MLVAFKQEVIEQSKLPKALKPKHPANPSRALKLLYCLITSCLNKCIH